jgi:hypothetical protein
MAYSRRCSYGHVASICLFSCATLTSKQVSTKRFRPLPLQANDCPGFWKCDGWRATADLLYWIVCNLYSLNCGQDALRRFFKITRDETSNQFPILGIRPNTLAPVVRQEESGRVMESMRWGFHRH